MRPDPPPSRSLSLRTTFTILLASGLLASIGLGVLLLLGKETLKPQQAFTVQNGYLWIDGEPFFPIGIYNAIDFYSPTPRRHVGVHGVNQRDLFLTLKESGFNTVHTYYSGVNELESFLELADHVGLRVMAYPGAVLTQDAHALERFRENVPFLRNHPSLVAWYLADEPISRQVRPVVFKEASVALRNLDPKRPIAAVIANLRHVQAFAPAVDILMSDQYPVPNRSIVEVAKYLATFRREMSDHQALWAVIQAFGYQGERLEGWGKKREPTYEEERCMAYLAVVHGATGLFYYTYYGSQYYIPNSPQHWEEIKRLTGELRQLYPLLLVPSSKEEVIVETHSELGTAFVAARGEDDHADLSAPIHYTIKRLNRQPYLIAVNTHANPLQLTFSRLPFPEGEVPVLFEGRSVQALERTLSDTFDPYAVHVYGQPLSSWRQVARDQKR